MKCRLEWLRIPQRLADWFGESCLYNCHSQCLCEIVGLSDSRHWALFCKTFMGEKEIQLTVLNLKHLANSNFRLLKNNTKHKLPNTTILSSTQSSNWPIKGTLWKVAYFLVGNSALFVFLYHINPPITSIRGIRIPRVTDTPIATAVPAKDSSRKVMCQPMWLDILLAF